MFLCKVPVTLYFCIRSLSLPIIMCLVSVIVNMCLLNLFVEIGEHFKSNRSWWWKLILLEILVSKFQEKVWWRHTFERPNDVVAKATFKEVWEDKMLQLKEIKQDAYEWLMKTVDTNAWYKHAFSYYPSFYFVFLVFLPHPSYLS